MTPTCSNWHVADTAERMDGTGIPILEFRDVGLSFGSRAVLARADISLASAEFLSIVGPSGSGKSTVLNLAAGLIEPNHGEVWYAGSRLQGVNTSVGYMTQHDTLLPWRTVEDNVAMPLKVKRLPRNEIREKVSSVLELLELRDTSKLYPSQLSGGMRRRALLARSIIYEPRLLLMDEPFGALDSQLREILQQELLRVVAHAQQAVLFITHDVTEAVLLSDRVLTLGGGPPAEVRSSLSIPFGHARNLESLRFAATTRELESTLHSSLKRIREVSETETASDSSTSDRDRPRAGQLL
jgi:NitT/TauT family transport system ATP-binding protein